MTDAQRARRRERDRERRAKQTPEQRAERREQSKKRREDATIAKFLGVGIRVGVSSGAPLPAYSRYPIQKSLSAMAANPWVWTAVQAIATDLSGLPLVAVQNGTQIKTHWLLQLLRQPNPSVSGLAFRKQLYADFALCRNARIRVWRDASGRPFQLARIHPNTIEPLVADDGRILGWKFPATGQTLTVDEVLAISDISWTDDASVAYGESVISPLALGIQVDSDVRKQAGKAARRGRLEMLLSPDGPIAAMPEEATRALVDEYQTATEGGRGVYVVGRQIKATPLSLTAREAEFANISDRTRDEILAAFGVPEVRAGKPSANYGTAVQQQRTYWESRKHDAALFEAQWSRLAEGEGVEVVHSFRQVAALQSSNTERLGRVSMHIAHGMEPNEAYAYEGFLDAPKIDAEPKDTGSPRNPAGPPDVTQPREPKAAVALVLRELAAVYAGTITDDAPPPGWIVSYAEARFSTIGISEEVAKEAAELVHESVTNSVAQLGTVGVASLRVFDSDHAERLARCLTQSTGTVPEKRAGSTPAS